jgi:hypothetical protein
MSINNREDANNYYKLINGLVDDYIDNHKIRPSKLSSYLRPGGQRFNKFLERNKLKDVKGAEIILKDVIEDRNHMESDGVITFESFKYFESNDFKISNLKECLYKGIDKADIKMEKILADYFDVNLGSIDVLDSDKHKFKLEDWQNDDWNVVIYSKEEYEVILYNVIEHLYEELSKKEIDLIDGISIQMSKLINENIFENKMSDILIGDKLNKLISNCLGEDWSFKEEAKDYFIWIS